jgi:hypothetical protein
MAHQLDAPEMDGFAARHPAFLDDAPRSEIFGMNQRENVVEFQMFETELASNRIRSV